MYAWLCTKVFAAGLPRPGLWGLLLLAVLGAPCAWAATGNTAAQYTSIHLIPVTRTFTKNGLARSFSTTGYKNSYNFISEPASSVLVSNPDITDADISGIIACSLNISTYPGCATTLTATGLTAMDFGNALYETLLRVKGTVERDIAHVKVWLPAGAIAAPLSIFTSPQARTQFLAKLDGPPQGTFPKDTRLVSAGSPLAYLLAGQEVVGYNAAGGGSFQFSYFGDAMNPLPTGRWLYMDWYLNEVGYDGAGGQQVLGRMNGSIGLKNAPFQAEYKRQMDCRAFESNGDPIAMQSACPSNTPAALPAPIIVTPSAASATSSVAVTGTQDARLGSTANPIMVDIYLDGAKANRAAVSGFSQAATWSQKLQLPTVGAHTLYAVASNSSGSSNASNSITLLNLPDGSLQVTTLNADGAPGVGLSGGSAALYIAGSFPSLGNDASVATSIDVMDAATVPESKVCSGVAVSAAGKWSCSGILALGGHKIYALAKVTAGTVVSTQSSAKLAYSVLSAPANYGVKIDPKNASLQGLTLTVASGDIGKRVALFVAVLVDGEPYFLTGKGIISYRDLSTKNMAGTIPGFSLYLATTTSGKFVYDVLPGSLKNVDLTQYMKATSGDRYATIQVIVGYGVVNTDADLLVNLKMSGNATDAFSTMLKNGTFQSLLK